MVKIITENFKSQSTIEFYESLDVNNYYIFASSIDKDNDINNSQYEKRDFLRRAIFGVDLDSQDARFIFPRNDWVSGTIYDAFDDKEDISELDMFVTVLTGALNEGSYRVYKCLDNNQGAASTVEPSGTGSNVDDYIFTLGDGYVWKFMFEIPASEYIDFRTANLSDLPYYANQNVISSARESISDIKVIKSRSNLFVDYLIGQNSVASSISLETGNRYKISVTTEIDPLTTDDEYQNMYLYFYEDNNGEYYEILESRYTTNQSEITLDLFVETTGNPIPLQGSKCVIVPKIDISKSNNGGTDAKAWAELDTSGNVIDINFFERGSSYKYASAKIALPPTLASQNNIETENELRVILSPLGGHGSNPISEMYMSRLMLFKSFGPVTNIPTSGQYTKIGLVKNPTFNSLTFPTAFDNRMIVKVNGDITGDALAVVGNTVEQTINGETLSGTIHEVGTYNGTETTLYLVDYEIAASTILTAGNAILKDTNTFTNISINSVTAGDYDTYTGEVLNFVDFSPITRTAETKEKIKLIFDF